MRQNLLESRRNRSCARRSSLCIGAVPPKLKRLGGGTRISHRIGLEIADRSTALLPGASGLWREVHDI